MFLYGIAALAFFTMTMVAGYSVAMRYRGKLSWMETAAASPIIGIIMSTWAALVAYLLTGSLDAGIIFVTVLMLAVTIWLRPWTEKPAESRKHLLALFIILAAASMITYRSLLTYFDGQYHIAFPLFGDTAFHTSIITSLSQGGNYLPQYPIMAGQLLRYTFLNDFYSAMLDHLGLGIQWSVVLPGIILMTSLFYLLYSLGCRFTGREAGGWITIAIIAFSGGLQFLQAIKDWISAGLPITTFLLTHNLNYTCVFELNYVFTNFTDIILAQRAALIGFAAGALIILISYILYVERGNDEKTPGKTLLATGVLAGLLPLFHTYSYACVMISMILLFMLFREKRWYYFMLPALILAIPQALYISGQGAPSEIRLQAGWMVGSPVEIPVFWIMNLGLGMVMLIAGLYVADGKKVKFYLPYLAIFFVANLIIFQTWNYDNHKFFSFWLMPSALFMATALLHIYDIRILGKPIFAVLFILTTLTGALVIFFLVAQTYVEFSTSDVYVADWISQNTPPDAVFLTGDSPTHPAIALAGRLSYLGYYPWMYTHGVDTTDRVNFVAQMYNANDKDQMFRSLKEQNISYVYLGSQEFESETYYVNESTFDGLEPVFNWTAETGETYRIFKVA